MLTSRTNSPPGSYSTHDTFSNRSGGTTDDRCSGMFLDMTHCRLHSIQYASSNRSDAIHRCSARFTPHICHCLTSGSQPTLNAFTTNCLTAGLLRRVLDSLLSGAIGYEVLGSMDTNERPETCSCTMRVDSSVGPVSLEFIG